VRNVREVVQESLDVKQALLRDDAVIGSIEEAARLMTRAFREGGRALFCGNGGSAADAQHFAAELSGRFLIDRDPLPAEALHTNTSFLTAVANDYSYDVVFARAVRSTGRAGDVLVAISTSGNAPSIVEAARTAQEIGMAVIALTGEGGGALRQHATVWLPMPSSDTARIQESHIAVIHAISEHVEAALFGPALQPTAATAAVVSPRRPTA
jgi:D-sedoheptulose 7-phosphate isomerase